MNNKEIELYDLIVEYGIATTAELNLARNLVSGSWLEVLQSVLYIRTGYRTWEQFEENELEEN